MAEITLLAESGRTTGSASSRRLRAAGRIPAVVYGHGVEGTSVSVDARELRHALSGESGLNQLLSLRIGAETHLAMARSMQRHPVRHTVVHVDFQVVSRDEVIAADVPVILTGEARAVELEGGLIEHVITTLTVHATPGAIPTHIEVDITNLTVGEGIRVADLALPAGVTTDIPADEIIVIAAVSRVEADIEEAEEAGDSGRAEGSAGAGSEGPGDAAGSAGEG